MPGFLRLVSVVAAAWLLGACAGGKVSRHPIDSLSLDEARQKVAGRTVMTFVGDREVWIHVPGCLPGRPCGGPTEIKGPGTLIEYFSPDGRSFLWHPKSESIGLYAWALAKRQGGYDMCFYQHDNPRGPSMVSSQCILLSEYVSTITETAAGDLFDLESGQVPFILNRSPTSFDALLNRRPQ